MFKKAIWLSVFALLILGAQAQIEAPKYSNEFLNIGVGARAFGMSQANIASVSDVTAGYWNPARLNTMTGDVQLAAMHSEYFAGIAKYDYAAGGFALDSNRHMAISVIRFGVDDIPNTTELIDSDGNVDYDRITTFTAADYAFLLSYQQMLGKTGISVGGNAKIIYRQIGDFSRSWGFGFDLGAYYAVDKWQFAAVMRDVTTTFNAWSTNLSPEALETFELTGNETPEDGIELTLPRLSLGVARSWKIGQDYGILAEANVDFTTDGQRNTLISWDPISGDPKMGIEANYKNAIFLRLGIGNFQQTRDIEESVSWTYQPNLGVGLQFKKLAIDYALTDLGDQSVAQFSNVFSLRYDIYKQK